MGEPVHDRFGAGKQGSRRKNGPVDQYDRNPEDSSRFQLCLGPGATGVLGDHMGDAMLPQKGKIAFCSEGATRDDGTGIRQRQDILRRIDQPQKIVMMGLRGEGLKVLFADRQKDTRRTHGQGIDGGINVRDMVPVITWARAPARPFEAAKRRAGLQGGGNGVAAHPRRKGMGGIDDVGDPLAAEIFDQPFDPAKAADARRQRLRNRAFRSAGIGEYRVNPCAGQRPRQLRGFGGAAQKKDASHG